MMLATVASLAIVSQDALVLRAAPRESAAAQAQLWQGDVVEVRGSKLDYLQVYDHRHERAGYVRRSAIQTTNLSAADAPALLTTVRFLREQPGMETLGMAYVAAYLQAAPAGQITAEPFVALGVMAERLAKQASSRKNADAELDAHVEIAASYGVKLLSVERNGQLRLCYEGDAWRRVMALPATAEQQAQAALALTRHDCISPDLPPLERMVLDQWRAQILDRVDVGQLPDYQQNRVHLRRAGVWASIAFARSRKGEDVQSAAQRAMQELADVVPQNLSEDDKSAYTEAAIRVGASRQSTAFTGSRLTIKMVAGEQPGQRCVQLLDSQNKAPQPLMQRCTYGTVWANSLRSNADNSAVTLSVQPLDGWRELWVLRKTNDGWTSNVLPPANSGPDLGYIEFAGWLPGTNSLLVAREARVEGKYQRSFEVVRLDDLVTEKKADHPEALSAFIRWQDAGWKRETVSVR